MFTLAAAAALATSPPGNQRAAPVVAQATATVRIISGVSVRFDQPNNPDAPPAHDSKIRTDGATRQARLIEFE
jgi:hypothetical protein